MNYAYTTETGRMAIERRNRTADFYACVHGLRAEVSPDPLDPIAISFARQGRVQAVAIVRNRTETLANFGWPSILITASKVHALVHRARRTDSRPILIVGMADGPLLTWEVSGFYEIQRTTTKADCIGSGLATRDNMFFPIDEAQVIEPWRLL
jgi:hypothetical protein